MAEKNSENEIGTQDAAGDLGAARELDAGGKSLSDALRVSFVILKVIMIVLVVAFLASGFKIVRPDERAVVLRFGRIKGAGDEKVLGPGPHWIFPYPIDEMIRIPAEQTVTLAINSFWYYQTEQEMLSKTKPTRIPDSLDPIKDGYCLTRSEQAAGAGGDSDYNIIHSRWQLVYQIADVEKFFRNVYVEQVKPGEVYFDSMTKSIEPLLKYVVEDAAVTVMVNYTIDEALVSRARIPEHVKEVVQKKLEDIESGIKVEKVALTEMKPPRQVDIAFEYWKNASETSQDEITGAETYRDNTLTEAAGPVARELYESLRDRDMSEEDRELLWSRAAGNVRRIIAQARADRHEVVESARASSDYLNQLLPEYINRPKLVVKTIYIDALAEAVKNADEVVVVQPTEGAGDVELRVLINKNPMLKSKAKKENQQSTEEKK